MMKRDIPERLIAFRSELPILDEAENWQLLRKWALSEVYRAALRSGGTRIIKWGGDDMAKEAAVYTTLLAPLGIRTPILYAYAHNCDGGLLVMEDVGSHNLEQHPEREYFLEAVREMARFRTAAAAQLARKDADAGTMGLHALSAEHFIQLLDDLIQSERLHNDSTLLRAAECFPGQVERLYQIMPPTLVHHDYHAKNLVIQGERIMPIDWPIAYISPHLGDLYCLITEARSWCDVAELEILEVYRTAISSLSGGINSGTDVGMTAGTGAGTYMADLQWQVHVGGLCWLIKSLRWLVYGGTETIPGSDAWIPDLLSDINLLVDRLELNC